MVLAKQILELLNQHECLDGNTLATEIEDLRTDDRLSFLCKNGYIKKVGQDLYEITPRGKEALRKI